MAAFGMDSTIRVPREDGDTYYDPTIQVKAPMSGMVFFSRYRLERVLGRGGMGVVWLADDLKLERPVALKFLPSLLGLDATAIKELKTETRRGLELSHPNIVRIYDFVDDEDMAAITMEFVDGKTLSEMRLGLPHGVFSVAGVQRWLPDVCSALDYAHFHRKLVHRDLKPANIMVTSKDHIAKVADFGIARSLADTMSRLTAAQTGASGTLPYMSPQQALGDRPLPTDDVYSLGALIYEVLSGKPPFYRGDISTQLTSKVPSSMVERREELEIQAPDSIPKEWEVAIAKCLHKDASMRPQSAGALAEMLGLQATLKGVGTKTFIQTGGIPAQPAEAEPKSRVPVYAAVAAGAVMAIGAVMYLMGEPEPAPDGADKVQAPVETVAAAVVPAKAPAVVAEPRPATEPADEASAPASASAAPVVAAAEPVAPALVQPPVLEPPNGYWPLTMLFPTPPQAEYSENGRRHLLYEVQAVLREEDLYQATQDGKEGKGTHNAIVFFQSRNGLVPNGLLDGPTLAAMDLGGLPDEPQWKAPAVATTTPTRKRRTPPAKKDEPNMLQRAGKSLGKLFKRD